MVIKEFQGLSLECPDVLLQNVSPQKSDLMMGSEQKFWVVRDNARLILGNCVAILTSGPTSSTNRYWRGEYFLFVSGESNYFDMQATHIDTGKVPSGFMTIDHAFFETELLQQIETRAHAHDVECCMSTSDYSALRSRPSFAEIDKRALVHLWMQGKFRKELNQARQATHCASLRDYLSFITDLPSLEYKPIDG